MDIPASFAEWHPACFSFGMYGRIIRSNTIFLALVIPVLCGEGGTMAPALDFTQFLGDAIDTTEPVAVATNAKGNIYVAGITNGANLPTVNAIQPEYSPGYCSYPPRGCFDIFVGKLRPDGSEFIYLTYLGGSLDDRVTDLAVDDYGNAYLVGVSASSEFPIQLDLEPDTQATERPFALKLNPDGSEILYATRLPGREAGDLAQAPMPSALAVDPAGAAYVTGTITGRGIEEINGLGLMPGEMDSFRSDDRGETWAPNNRGLIGVIGAFEFAVAGVDREGNTVLYAASSYGLFRKSGAAAAWEEITPASISAINDIVGLEMDPENPGRIYLASSHGLLLSSDSGRSWQDLSSTIFPAAEQIYSLATAPSASATLYAGGRKNFFRSDDGGLTWSPSGLSSSIEAFGVTGLLVDPHDPDTVYGTVYRGFGFDDILAKSEDGGVTWRELYAGDRPSRRFSLAIDPANPSAIYLGTREGLLRSVDGGTSWSDRGDGLPNTAVDYVEVDPFDPQRVYAGGRHGPYRSDDAGQTWKRVNNVLPQEMSSVIIDPGEPNRLYVFGRPNPANAYVLKLSPDGSRLEYSTLLGGSSNDIGFDIEVDETGRAWVTGYTASLDFPTTRGSYTPVLPSEYVTEHSDGFLVRLDPSGSQIEEAAYLGGRIGRAVAPESEGTVLVAGWTPDTNGNRDGAHWGVDTQSWEITEVNRLGGPGDAEFNQIAVAPDGRTCLRGWTSSEGLIPGGPPYPWAGHFVTCLASGGAPEWSAQLGRSGGAVAPDSDGRMILAGAGVPGMAPFEVLLGGWTAFVTRFRFVEHVPEPRVVSVVNAAHFQAGSPSPGLIVSVFGDGLGPEEGVAAQPSEGRFPTQLGGARVLVDNQPAPLLFVQEGQINAVLPFGLEIRGQVGIRVSGPEGESAPFYLTVAPAAPGVFAASGSGTGQAAVLNENNTLNSVENPAPRGSIVQIFATGGGALAPLPADGLLQPLDPPFPAIALPVEVRIDSVDAEVTYAGAAPGLIGGVIQVNARVPDTVLPRADARVAVVVAGRGEPPTAWIAIK